MIRQCNTPKLRFSEFEDDWVNKRYSEIFTTFKSGQTITSSNIHNSGMYPVYGGNGLRGYTDKFTHEGYYFLIGRQGALCGNIKRVSEKSFISEHAIACKVESDLSTEFYAQRLYQLNLNRFSESSAQPGLSVNKLLRFKLDIPTVSEQQKIASFLSTVDKKIALLTEKKAKLTEYKKGVMQQLFNGRFQLAVQDNQDTPLELKDGKGAEQKGEQGSNQPSGKLIGQPSETPTFIPPTLRFKADDSSDFPDWEEKKLGGLGSFSGGGTPDTKNPIYWTGDVPWISSSDVIENNIFKIEKTRFITREAIEESATKIVSKNSILIVSRVGVGKFVVSTEDICTSQDFSNFTPKGLDIIFMAYNLYFNKHKLESLAQGTSIKGFTTGDLKSLKIGIPSKREQTKIANFLSAIDQKIDLAKAELEKAKHWKKGLLQQMFV